MSNPNPPDNGKVQYMLNGIRFGANTNMPVSKAEIQPWNVNNQDFQIIRTDEVRFGLDNLVPAPIVFTMAVLNNWQLESIPGEGVVPDSFLYQARSLLGQLANAWKSTDVRRTWGAMVCLSFVDPDGTTRRVYGRPGKFQHGTVEQKEWVDVQAEFRRADTNAYDDRETVVELLSNDNPVVIFRDRGDAPAWFRLLIYGPITHPIITIGNVQVELAIDIPSNTVLECSSYPWMRRIVDSNNINWRAALIGDSQYLDQCQIPAGQDVICRWTDENVNTWTELPSGAFFQNPDFLDMFAMTSNWHTLAGTPIWGFSPLSGGYLHAPFGITAITDINNAFTTPDQYVQATIACIYEGRSTIVFKSAIDMSSFVGAQIVKTRGLSEILGDPTPNDKLRIVVGAGYNSVSTVFEYAVPSPGLFEGQNVAILYNSITGYYELFWEGNVCGVWNGPGVVSDANMTQGFVLNEDNDVLKLGVGLNNLVAYDYNWNPPTPPADPNDMSQRVFLYWRDAWSIE